MEERKKKKCLPIARQHGLGVGGGEMGINDLLTSMQKLSKKKKQTGVVIKHGVCALVCVSRSE